MRRAFRRENCINKQGSTKESGIEKKTLKYTRTK